MDPKNLVSAEISKEAQARALALIDELRALLPLISLSKEERKSLPPVSDDAFDACKDIATAAAQNPTYVAADLCDPVEMRRDAALAEALTPIDETLTALQRDVRSTRLAARSDVFRGGSSGYSMLSLARTRVAGLDALLEKLRAVFARRGRKSTKTTSTETPTEE